MAEYTRVETEEPIMENDRFGPLDPKSYRTVNSTGIMWFSHLISTWSITNVPPSPFTIRRHTNLLNVQKIVNAQKVGKCIIIDLDNHDRMYLHINQNHESYLARLQEYCTETTVIEQIIRDFCK